MPLALNVTEGSVPNQLVSVRSTTFVTEPLRTDKSIRALTSQQVQNDLESTIESHPGKDKRGQEGPHDRKFRDDFVRALKPLT